MSQTSLPAVDEAVERLKTDMAQQFFSAGEFFEVVVQKEPVKEIHLTEEGIKEFLHDQFVWVRYLCCTVF